MIAVNQAWRDFVRTHQSLPHNASEGVNYLAMCNAVTGADAESTAAFAASIRAVMRGEREEISLEYPCHSPTVQRWFMVRVTRFVSEGKVRIVIAHESITERKQAEAELRASRELHQSILETVSSGFWRTDLRGHLLEVNAAYCRMSGYTESELLAMDIGDVEATESPAQMLTHMQRIVAQRHHGFESRHRRKDGSVFDVEISAQYRPTEGGQVVAFLRDVTERKMLETERAAALARLAVVEEQERHRLSRELHDQTAQRLVALAVELKNLETNLAAGRPQAERVRALRKAVDELQQQVYRIAWDLCTVEVAQGGLANALQAYVEDWSEHAQVPADCECRIPDRQRLPALVEVALYRVAQEALANVQRHAQARRVSVLLEREASRVRLTVEDDGRGFDVDAIQKSPDVAQRLGLLGMKERITLVGGTLLIESSPGAGTTILVRIPIPTEAKPS